MKTIVVIEESKKSSLETYLDAMRKLPIKTNPYNPTLNTLPFEWVVKNLKPYKTNRICQTDLESIDDSFRKNITSKSELLKAKRRIEKVKKGLLDRGEWLISCPMVISYYDGKFFIVDGNTRLKAAMEVNSDKYIIKEIPIVIVPLKNEKDVFKEMISLNTNKTNWTKSNFNEANAVYYNDDSYMRKKDEILKALDVQSNYFCDLIIFGCSSSHVDTSKICRPSKEYKEGWELEFQMFKDIYCTLNKIYTKSSSKIVYKKIRRQLVAQAFDGLYSAYIRVVKYNHIENFGKDTKVYKDFIKEIIDCINNDDARFLVTAGKQDYVKRIISTYMNEKTKKITINKQIGQLVLKRMSENIK